MNKETAQRAGIAFKLGVAFGQGIAHSRKQLTQDEAKWITVKPHGENAKGRPALIDGETGQILGGMGGKFNGARIEKGNKQGFKKLADNKPKSRRQMLLEKRKQNDKLDFSLPEKIDNNVIIQNRDRSKFTSQDQINAIASHPDYFRLSNNNSLSDGAPVVAYGSIPADQMGKVTTAVASDGTRYKVQYAVIDADKVQTSHINGNKNEQYYSDDPNVTRAIAGNGRISGLKKAYEKNTMSDYQDELLLDDSHGVNADVIEKMKKPILVRVMQPKDVTADIGDKTNTQTNMQMSAVEQANNDVQRINLKDLDLTTYENGEPTKKAILDFVYKLPQQERGNLIDDDSNDRKLPTKQAEERFKGYLFAKAYNDNDLLRLSQQAQDPEGKNFIKALNMSAPKIAQLENVSPEFDVRPLLTENIKKVIAQKKEGKPLADLLGQLDTNQTEQEALINKQVLECLIENINKPAVLSNKFNKLATLMQIENNQAKENPMYALMSEPKENIIKRAFEDKKEITGDSQNKLFSFWKKNFYLVMSDDKRKHKKYFRKLHELKI